MFRPLRKKFTVLAQKLLKGWTGSMEPENFETNTIKLSARQGEKLTIEIPIEILRTVRNTFSVTALSLYKKYKSIKENYSQSKMKL